jgi:hypothetical protein
MHPLLSTSSLLFPACAAACCLIPTQRGREGGGEGEGGDGGEREGGGEREASRGSEQVRERDRRE